MDGGGGDDLHNTSALFRGKHNTESLTIHWQHSTWCSALQNLTAIFGLQDNKEVEIGWQDADKHVTNDIQYTEQKSF